MNMKETALLIIKKWKVTLLIPVICSGVLYVGMVQYFKGHQTYTSTASFALGMNDTEKKGIQNKLYNQSYNEGLLQSIPDLVKNAETMKKSVEQVYGKQAFSTQQMMYQQIPKAQSSTKIVNTKGSLIFTVSFESSSAKNSKKMVNSILDNTKLLSEKMWKSNTFTVLSKGVQPINSNSKRSLIFKIVTGFAVISVISISLFVIDTSRKQ